MNKEVGAITIPKAELELFTNIIGNLSRDGVPYAAKLENGYWVITTGH